MNSNLFRLNLNDFWKGAVSAVAAALVFTIAGLFSGGQFDLFTADWVSIGQMAANAAVAAFVGYISKNFISDSEGRPFGVGK